MAKSKKAFEPKATHKIGTVLNGESTKIVAAIHNFDDRAVLDIRTWYKLKTMKDWAPTGKGVSIPLDRLSVLRKALKKATRVAIEEGYIDEDGDIVERVVKKKKKKS